MQFTKWLCTVNWIMNSNRKLDFFSVERYLIFIFIWADAGTVFYIEVFKVKNIKFFLLNDKVLYIN